MSRIEQREGLLLEVSEGMDYVPPCKFERTAQKKFRPFRLVNDLVMLVVVAATTVTSIAAVFEQIDTKYDTGTQVGFNPSPNQSGS